MCLLFLTEECTSKLLLSFPNSSLHFQISPNFFRYVLCALHTLCSELLFTDLGPFIVWSLFSKLVATACVCGHYSKLLVQFLNGPSSKVLVFHTTKLVLSLHLILNDDKCSWLRLINVVGWLLLFVSDVWNNNRNSSCRHPQ